MITETNLDRFDTTCLTWRHPWLSRARLSELLFQCYHRFLSFRHTLQNVKAEVSFRSAGMLKRSVGSLAMSLFTRYCAWRRTHPMSGGVKRVRLDGVDDYLPLRTATFGFEMAPLPQSLRLPAAEIQRNQVLIPQRRASLSPSADQSLHGEAVLSTDFH